MIAVVVALALAPPVADSALEDARRYDGPSEVEGSPEPEPEPEPKVTPPEPDPPPPTETAPPRPPPKKAFNPRIPKIDLGHAAIM